MSETCTARDCSLARCCAALLRNALRYKVENRAEQLGAGCH